MQVMDWGDLPFFLAVAELGTLARGAARLRTDPTTVGRRIQKLERALGVRLFEHTRGGHVLTPEGTALREKARAMERLATEATLASRGGTAAPITGTVRLSVAEGFGSAFLAPRIGSFADRHPGLTVDLVANSGFLNPTRRETDLAVLLARPRRGPLVTSKLTDYTLGLYASKDYVARHGPIETRDRLVDHRLVGYVPDIVYAPELRFLDELPNVGPVALRSSSINAQARMIAAGAGLGVLPHFIGRLDASLVPVLPDITIQRSFWLVAHAETAAFPQVRAMRDWLRETVAAERELFLPG
jgi:DNA-binding transcriptional LysR family regulator